MKQLSEMSEREYFANVGRRPGMFVGKPFFHMLAAGPSPASILSTTDGLFRNPSTERYEGGLARTRFLWEISRIRPAGPQWLH
ncbi:hypothetical protein ACXZ65_28010 [Streptomyces aculeolatus]